MSLLDFIRIAAIGLSVVVVLIGGALLLMPSDRLESLFGTGALEPTDFRTLERKDKPNSYLLCPRDHCPRARADAEAPVFDMPVEELRRRLLSLVDGDANLKVHAMDLERGYFEIIARTPSMRFPDIISVELLELPNGRSSLAIFSRSVYGYSDLGANRKRIERWLAIISP
ncbi:MAG: hypothetical protein Tsb008_20590 [Rhodothalassiaceae bacterium]